MKEKEATDFILLNAGYAVHQADWNYKDVNSPFARIYLVKDGKAKLHLKEQVYVLTPRHLYLIPPFTPHGYECDAYFTLFYIHVYENQFSSQWILEDYHFPVEVEASPLDALLVERLMGINPGRELKQYDPTSYDNSSTMMRNVTLHSTMQPGVILETKGILFQLFSRFLRQASPKYKITDRIRKSLYHIRKNIDLPIRINELTDVCCLSEDHFIRLFKKEMDLTPTQYINRKKIEKAQLMIITGDQSMKDIAYSLSFDSVSYFNRLFKKYTGFTPVEYKRQL
jgi:AraC-like DNA-binding protein